MEFINVFYFYNQTGFSMLKISNKNAGLLPFNELTVEIIGENRVL